MLLGLGAAPRDRIVEQHTVLSSHLCLVLGSKADQGLPQGWRSRTKGVRAEQALRAQGPMLQMGKLRLRAEGMKALYLLFTGSFLSTYNVPSSRGRDGHGSVLILERDSQVRRTLECRVTSASRVDMCVPFELKGTAPPWHCSPLTMNPHTAPKASV